MILRHALIEVENAASNLQNVRLHCFRAGSLLSFHSSPAKTTPGVASEVGTATDTPASVSRRRGASAIVIADSVPGGVEVGAGTSLAAARGKDTVACLAAYPGSNIVAPGTIAVAARTSVLVEIDTKGDWEIAEGEEDHK